MTRLKAAISPPNRLVAIDSSSSSTASTEETSAKTGGQYKSANVRFYIVRYQITANIFLFHVLLVAQSGAVISLVR